MFIPFFAYFLVALIYYHECMLIGVSRPEELDPVTGEYIIRPVGAVSNMCLFFSENSLEECDFDYGVKSEP